MAVERDALQLRTQIGQYWIHDVEYYGVDTITYRAEDMRLNREVWLHEYFPGGMARRHFKEDGTGTVYVHPTQHEAFEVAKARQRERCEAVKGVDHPAWPAVIEVFESGGTLYVVTRYSESAENTQRLAASGRRWNEQQLGQAALSFVSLLILLRRKDLGLRRLDIDTVLIDVSHPAFVAAYGGVSDLNEEGVSRQIRELGSLMYRIVAGVDEMPEPPEGLQADGDYSAALCGLINRMVSAGTSEPPKTFEELQTLLQSYQPAPSQCEPLVCEQTRNPLSTLGRLASFIVIAVFAYYVFTQPQQMDVKAFSWFDAVRFHLVAYAGNAEGQRALGEMYEKGYGVDQDVREAAVWYKKAAEQGNAYAQLSLGHFYSEGIGLPKNAEKAVYWYYQAAKQGNATAQYNIGYCYQNGIGVAEDEKEALRWYEKAAAQEIKEAKAYVASKEQQRIKNASRSVSSVSAQRNLAYLKLYGKADSDPKGAIEIYRRLAEEGDRNSQSHMGYLHMTGTWVKRDYTKAMYWFKKAVDQGDAYSCGAIGKMYRFGQGVPQNKTEARYWFTLGAKRGDGYSREKLQEMELLSKK